ncbi:single-stranded DNA-binding protein [Spirochaeta africana]|uniref:Single-stranded DNA-binding protein n=1 Tax=Spirochaeta africana (strain ATCC 700263 / DSM 8902 / Z-7692) TaxID=889378 RepID=H9UJF3_SPIAZ|nr:single-stranded DNA-binding protein [Spirochaeta africana]AFG37646.1 single stranded DNA-binding protein [Spirochaeta africana DSM 8902]
MAQDINVVVLVGRLTRDAELRITSSGLAICKFPLAVNRRKKQGEEYVDQGEFFNMVLMGRYAEIMHPYLKKGKKVGIEGEMRQNRWQDEAGKNHSRVEVQVNKLNLLGDPRGGSHDATDSGPAAPPPAGSYAGGGFDDDVPF